MSITPSSEMSWSLFWSTHGQNFDYIEPDKILSGRYIQLIYNEKTETENARRDLLDLKDGAIYLHLTARYMMQLFLRSAFARPVETMCRLSFHLCVPLSIPLSIHYAIQKENQRRKEFPWLAPRSKMILAAVAAARIVIDLIRIPYYGATLTLYAIAATYLYFKTAEDKEKQFYTMMRWRSIIARTERDMVWQDKQKCYWKPLQPMAFLHRVHRFLPPDSSDPHNKGFAECVRRRNKEYHSYKALSPVAEFLLKIPNFFSHSRV